MTIEYDGTDFAGWQRQKDKRSVQGTLESALERVMGLQTLVVGAGRTDSGVHATGQVAHFDSRIEKANVDWRRALNGVLERDVAVLDVARVPSEFHARHSASGRVYSYRLYTGTTRSPLSRRSSWHVGALDDRSVTTAAEALVGIHDFAALGRALTPGGPTVRHMRSVTVDRQGAFLRVEFEANAFLRHQVRRMVGLLVMVGRGAMSASQVRTFLTADGPPASFRRAPAQGLCLERVIYPDRIQGLEIGQ
jgi:tRNA pseudouridine38-40 synthase